MIKKNTECHTYIKFLNIEIRHTGSIVDNAIHARVGKRRVIDFIVPPPSPALQVNQHILAEFLAVFHGQTTCMNHFLWDENYR